MLEVSVQRVVLWLSNTQLSLIVLSGAFEINWGHHEQAIWLMKQGKIKSYAPVNRYIKYTTSDSKPKSSCKQS